MADAWPYDASNGANYYYNPTYNYNGSTYSGYWSDNDGDGAPDPQDSHSWDSSRWSDFDNDGRNAADDSHPEYSWLWSDWNFNYTNNDADGDEDGMPDTRDSHPRESWRSNDWNGDGSNLLKPKLNAWAKSDGSTEAKMAAATAGYLYQGLATLGTLVVTLNEAQNPHATANIIKRMGGHLTGLAISASMGSQPAKDELWRMCPFVSWESLKNDVKAKWGQGDYFGSGQLAAELAFQAVGDLTIFIPVAKGVATGVKLTAQFGKKLVQKLVQSSPRTFARTAIRTATEKLALTGRFDFYNIVDPTKAKAFYKELMNYYKTPSPGKIKWVDKTPSGYGGQFDPRTGDILIDNIYRTNSAARKSLQGLMTEEMIHFKQVQQAGLIGRTEAQIGDAVIDAFEDEIPRLMRQNGIEPSF